MSDTVTGAVHTAELLTSENITIIRRPSYFGLRGTVANGESRLVGCAYIQHACIPADGAYENARLFAAGFNSYRRHFGPHAVSAAEGDLLGKALEALGKLNALILFADQDDDGRAIVEMDRREIADAKAILSQAQAREVK